MTIEQVVPPAVTLVEARGYVRGGSGGDDAELTRWIGAATEACEAFTGVALVARACAEVQDVGGVWQRLSAGPVRAITSVEGVPAEGSAFALPIDAYAIDLAPGGIGRVRVSQPGAAGRVRVAYTAGLVADVAAVPDGIRQGVLLLVAAMARARDEGGSVDAGAAEALWRPWRRVRLS